MSYENRKREFQRLMDAGRQKDIPQDLMDEFKPTNKIKMPTKMETKPEPTPAPTNSKEGKK